MVRLVRRPIDRDASWPSISDWARDFDQLFGDMGMSMEPIRRQLDSSFGHLACDVNETDSGYLLSMDMPGISQEDIHVEADKGILTVSATRHEEANVDNAKSHRRERVYGELRRTFRLPEGVAPDNIQANYENGVLYLNLPKEEIAKPRKIEISSGKSGFLRNLIGKSEEKKQANS